MEDASPDLPGSGRYGAADCIFCAIVASSVPASIVYDDADLLAFMDIRPVTPGHLLIIPKRHTPFLADLDEVIGARMFTVAMQLAQALRASGLRCEGINLFLADGEAAFQEVFHTHLHVIPRFVGDTFRIDADWTITPSRAELDEIAAQVRRDTEAGAGEQCCARRLAQSGPGCPRMVTSAAIHLWL
jgi:histidine triad (HIT) family protein